MNPRYKNLSMTDFANDSDEDFEVTRELDFNNDVADDTDRDLDRDFSGAYYDHKAPSSRILDYFAPGYPDSPY